MHRVCSRDARHLVRKAVLEVVVPGAQHVQVRGVGGAAVGPGGEVVQFAADG
jgi:hypothetical protein